MPAGSTRFPSWNNPAAGNNRLGREAVEVRTVEVRTVEVRTGKKSRDGGVLPDRPACFF